MRLADLLTEPRAGTHRPATPATSATPAPNVANVASVARGIPADAHPDSTLPDDPPSLAEALAAACAPVGLDPAVLRAELGAQDLADYAAGELTPEALAAWARGITIRRMRERGEVPAHYTAVTTCKGCGPVPIFAGCPDQVEGCPWCFNRLAGLPMPKGTGGATVEPPVNTTPTLRDPGGMA